MQVDERVGDPELPLELGVLLLLQRGELAVHLVGEVTGIEPDLGRIELAPIPDARGPAPRGSGVGDWLSPLVSVTRPDVIELLFGESESEDATGDDRAPDALSWTGPLNQILYGPPGTGKTYRLRADLFPKFTRTSSSTVCDDPTIEALEQVFATSVLPLLSEYFYADLDRIGLVLGAPFVHQVSQSATLADFPHDAADQLADRTTYHLASVGDLSTEDFLQIYDAGGT